MSLFATLPLALSVAMCDIASITTEADMRKLILTIPVIGLAACAANPDSIAPISVSSRAYDYLTCQEAVSELAQSRHTLSSLESQQRNAVAGDALGVLFIGVPVSSLAGADKEGLIAAEKGKVLALEGRVNSCRGA